MMALMALRRAAGRRCFTKNAFHRCGFHSMNSVYMIACGCTDLDSYSPGLAAQGWVSTGQHVLRWRPDGKGCVIGLLAVNFVCCCLNLELHWLFSSQ